MFKTLLATLLALFAAAAFAVDANKATQAELEAVKGIGPTISAKILDERKKGAFKDWSDMVERVKGVGDSNAAKFSSEGLTVNGAGFKGAAPAAKKEDKPAAKTAAATAPAAAPAVKGEMKKDAKPAAAASAPAEDKKAMVKKEREDKKAAKAKAAEAKASEAKATKK